MAEPGLNASTPSTARPDTPHSVRFRRARRGSILKIGLPTVALALSPLIGCGDDEEDVNERSGATFERAYAVFTRILGPDQRTNFITMVGDIEPQEIDISNALELNDFSRIREFEGDLIVFAGESAEITRYRVEADLSLTEIGRFSMANDGIDGFSNTLAFISATRAYYIDAQQRRVVVWNPREMTRTGAFDIELAVDGFPNATVGTPAVIGDEVLFAIQWNDATGLNPRPVVGVGELSATQDGVFAVNTDDTCGVSQTGFAASGRYYAVGDWSSGAASVYSEFELPDPCAVEYDPESSEFSGNVINLIESTGAPLISAGFGIDETTFAVRVFDDPRDIDAIPQEIPNPRNFLSLEAWRWAVVTLPGGGSERVEGLPLSNTSFPPVVIDGAIHLPIEQQSEGRGTLFRVDGIQATPTIEAAGEILNVVRLR